MKTAGIKGPYYSTTINLPTGNTETPGVAKLVGGLFAGLAVIGAVVVLEKARKKIAS